jgi:hypothetical protein
MKWCAAIFAVTIAQAQPPQNSEAELFGKIQARVKQNLNHLPDYTCSETIERFRRSKPGGKLDPVDTIRLEVAYVGGQELFGWPGSNKINDPDIGKFVPGGTSGNGDFGLLPKNLFLVGGAKISYAGETELDGRRVIRFNYRVAETARSYQLQSNSGKAFVGYEGALWVDPVTLDLTRISSSVEVIPPALKLKSTSTVLDYSPATFGATTFLLPKSSELKMVEAGGAEFVNRNSFHGCRQFSGESVIKFDSPSAEPIAIDVPAVLHLPDEFEVEIELETAVDSASSAVGDPLRANIRQDVKRNREVIIPKGAVLTGNLVMMEKRGAFYLLDLQLTSLEINGRTVDLSSRENTIGMVRVRNGRSLPTYLSPMPLETGRVQLARGKVLRFRSRTRR